ncbi:polyketide synthase dehydratase domain-containing protein [Micromonospora coxensis]|uniref:Polyketide synthase dehydratase n=1 Tax=Micromonospora coxensis TaxID=356852 RepID=A0A1C5HCY8_9ACTN|nr:polyketide synthase dehydratase domain-containing protein [Micromonospora coxensis]SCG43899.1 Polyketide synthase dehydratase [Micromonospora coxensis]
MERITTAYRTAPGGAGFAARFTTSVLAHEPGRLLVTATTLGPGEDPYLDDPGDGDAPVLPVACALEALAQAWAALTGHLGPPVIEAVEFGAPLVVPRDGAVELRLTAVAGPETGTAEVTLRSAYPGGQVDHVRARLRHRGAGGVPDRAPAVRYPAATVPVPAALPVPPARPVEPPPMAIDPAREVYDGLVRRGRRLRRLLRYREITGSGCVAELAGAGAAWWFAGAPPEPLVLGDPGLRDAFLHALQPWAPDAVLQPLAVDRIWSAGVGPYEQVTLHAVRRDRNGDVHRFDLEALAGGRVVERWTGLRLRLRPAGRPPGPWPAQVLGPYLHRRLIELLGVDAATVLEPGLHRERRRQHTALAVSRLLGGGATVRYRPDGRPEVGGGWWVSAAHGATTTLAVAARTPVGCDLEPVARRERAEWRHLLNGHLALAELVAAETGEPLSTAATRVWSALESLHKVGVTAVTPLIHDRNTADRWVLLTAGGWRVATCVVGLRGGPDELVVAVASEG